MNKPVAFVTVALVGVLASQFLTPERRHRLGAGVRRRLAQRMERMMAEFPEQSPPRLIMSILPELLEQNVEIIAMLREQNAMLREKSENEP